MEDQRVVALTAENVLRLEAFYARFDQPAGVVVLAGPNASGKSSVLNAILMAIKGDLPERPLRDGATDGSVVVETQDMLITKRITQKDTYLTVEMKEGFKASRPQAMLDALAAGPVGFDPLAFARMDAKKQAETLLRVCPVKLDLAANANERKECYDRRTEVNRDIKRLDAQVAGMTAVEAPDEPVDAAALDGEYRRLLAAQRRRESAVDGKKQLELRLRATQDRVAALEKELAEERENETEQAEELSRYTIPADFSAEVEAALQKYSEAGRVNVAVEKKRQRAALVAERAESADEVQAIDKKIDALDGAREKALSAAAFPVPGLGMDEDGGVVLNGVPFAQASTAQQIKVGVALAAAGNPKLRLAMIRDGSLLDADSMKAVEQLAVKHNLLVLVERVSDDSPTAIQIRDGKAGEMPPKPEKKAAPRAKAKDAGPAKESRVDLLERNVQP